MHGGKRDGAGRKPCPARAVNKTIKWQPAEWQAVVDASKQSGIMPSRYIRQATMDKIKQGEKK